MKLRIHGDSLRLRLNRSDVEQFRISGVCAASFRFDSSSQLTYTFETSSRLTGWKFSISGTASAFCYRSTWLRNGRAPTGFRFPSTAPAASPC